MPEYWDIKGIPLMVGDIVKMYHFTTRNRRKVYMYKKALRQKKYNGAIRAVNLIELGEVDLEDCHSCSFDNLEFEIITGLLIQEIPGGPITCYWERAKKSKKKKGEK